MRNLPASQGLSAVVGGLEALQGEGVVFFGACVVQVLSFHAFAYFFSVWEVEWEYCLLPALVSCLRLVLHLLQTVSRV